MDALISFGVSFIVVPFIQWLKKETGMSGLVALWVTFVFSFILALVVTFVSNAAALTTVNLNDPFAAVDAIVKNLGVTMTTALLVYRSVVKKEAEPQADYTGVG
jgi:hypothetical protein